MSYLVFPGMIQFRLGNLTYAREVIEKALADPYVQENERWTGTADAIIRRPAFHSCFRSGSLSGPERHRYSLFS